VHCICLLLTQSGHGKARARVGDSRERSGRRTLQGMVNYGVVIVTGSGGKGGPLLYSMNPFIARTKAPAREREERRRCS
jgi:hypothetical protein